MEVYGSYRSSVALIREAISENKVRARIICLFDPSSLY